MSTTELDPGAGAAAVETQQTALPEQETAGDAHQQGETGDGSDQSQGTEEADKGLTEEQKTIRKLERRIARLTGKKGAAEREAELLRQQLSQIQQGGQQEEGEAERPGDRKLTEADIDRIANERAEQFAKMQTFRSQVSRVIEEGGKLEGFGQAVDALDEVLPIAKNGRPTPFMLAVVEAVEGSDMQAKVLKHLGENPDEAEKLAGLTPYQLGRRLAKLEDQLKPRAKDQSSSAPRPLQPVSARNAGVSSPRTPEDLLNELRSLRG